MAKQSRLKVGVDVPWVVSWTEEAMTGAAPCPTVDGELALGQVERPGYGFPLYSKNHVRRQRASMRDMLCPMCGEPTVAGDRWTVLAKRRTAGELRATGFRAAVPDELKDDRLMLDAGTIAPLHRACADRSLSLCPHLKANPATELMAFPETVTVSPLTTLAQRQVEHFRSSPFGQNVSVLAVALFQLCGIV
jgi:hypothetical protein